MNQYLLNYEQNLKIWIMIHQINRKPYLQRTIEDQRWGPKAPQNTESQLRENHRVQEVFDRKPSATDLEVRAQNLWPLLFGQELLQERRLAQGVWKGVGGGQMPNRWAGEAIRRTRRKRLYSGHFESAAERNRLQIGLWNVPQFELFPKNEPIS